jgi:hypothetical protein
VSATHRQYWIDQCQNVEGGLILLTSSSSKQEKGFFPLTNLEARFCSHPQYGRIMASLLDLALTHFFTITDFQKACGVFNEKLRQDQLLGKASAEITADRIKFLDYANSFVLRCRTLFDKMMGLLVLVLIEDGHRYISSPRRLKRKFGRLLGDQLTKESINSIEHVINALDSGFRTGEAHQTGKLRKWVLTDWSANPIETRFADLLTIYNKTLVLTCQIGNLLCTLPMNADNTEPEKP